MHFENSSATKGTCKMAKKRILYINQEIMPYVPESECSLLGREITKLGHENGYEVRTFMPRYGSINERRNQLHEVIRLSGINIPVDDADHPLILKVASMQASRIQVYFIDNEDFFAKEAGDVDVIGSNRDDNDERVIFFTRGTLETVRRLRWEADAIHCVGWMSALVPLYIKSQYKGDPTFRHAKIIYSITPEPKPSVIDENFTKKLQHDGIEKKHLKEHAAPFDVNTLHKLAIKHSDVVMISDPEANPELAEYATSLKKTVITYEEMQAKGKEAYTEIYKKIAPNDKK